MLLKRLSADAPCTIDRNTPNQASVALVLDAAEASRDSRTASTAIVAGVGPMPSTLHAPSGRNSPPNIPPSNIGLLTSVVSPNPPITTDENHPKSQRISRQMKGEWLDFWLRPPVLLLFALLTISMLGALISLCAISHRANGFTTVDTKITSFVTFKIGKPFLWTSLPVFVIQVYVLGLIAITTSFATRQPFVELHHSRLIGGRGAHAKVSIHLDYRSLPSFLVPFRAFRNRHYILAMCLNYSVFLQLFLTPLASHLFETMSQNTGKAILVSKAYHYDDSALPELADITSVFDIVLSSAVYGSQSIPWTTLSESFLPATGISDTFVGRTNVLFLTQAYNALLDCRILGPEDFELEVIEGQLRFSASDRGCSFPAESLTSFYPPVADYIITVGTSICDVNAGSSRIAVVAALNVNSSDSVLTNKTMVSCKTLYINRTVVLNVTTASPTFKDVTIDNFTVLSADIAASQPGFAYNFETQLNDPTIFELGGTTSATDFGHVILNYAQSKAPSTYFDGDILQKSVQAIFNAAFAVVATRYLVQPSASIMVPGTLYTQITRLYIVLPIAYGVIVMFFGVLAMITLIGCYTYKHNSILCEQPGSILAMTSILCKSDLLHDFEASTGLVNDGKAVQRFMEDPAYKELGWTMGNEGGKEGMIIRTPFARPNQRPS